jgi:hypothetical protein
MEGKDEKLLPNLQCTKNVILAKRRILHLIGLEILHFVQDDNKTGFAASFRVMSQIYLSKNL